MGCSTTTPSTQRESVSEVDPQVIQQRDETSGAERADVQACEEPRPEVCASIYAPVCALRDDGARVTHSNGCRACADVQVAAFVVGACPKR